VQKEKHGIVIKHFWMKGWGANTIHRGLMSTLGHNVYGWSQIKIRLHRFKIRDFPDGHVPRAGRTPLTLGSQLEVFLQKYHFASARIIARHFVATVPPVTDILHRELEMK
jgi:hypothetical protein